MLGSKARFVLAIANDRHFFQGDQAAFCKFGQDRKKTFDLLLSIDNLNDQRQVLRQGQYLRGVKHARPTKAKWPAQNRGAGKTSFARLEYARFIEGFVVSLVVLDSETSWQ